MPFEIVRNDITKMHVDAIVNPTNSKLYGTAGVDGAIHKIEGPRLREETAKIGRLEPGQCALTKAFNLPAGYIIHTVGPIWNKGTGRKEDILRNTYRNALELARKKGFESIAFPLISSGTYGCPKDVALNIAIRSIGEFLLFNEMTLYLVVFDKKSYQLSEDLFSSVEAYIDDNYIDEQEYTLLRRNRLMEKADYLQDDEALSESISSKMMEQVKPKKKSIDDAIHHLDETFSKTLLRMIDERGLKDPEVYKKANVTKQTFSKIRNNNQYNPTKQTVLAFAIALQLNLDEAKDLLLRSGYALSKSSRFDVIISYFFESENYDIYEINEVLFAYDQNLLGV
ncbi:RNase III inhibitor [Petrocella atlantisensis]|uniref:RNase III inhibitor n=1 Tax=Petrocella atlantisensis TaxID=2173034 RepID=A0A3P7S337_9FIRM|nr:macro domain-containing protein [Petrocella atlantisensis]VDN47169.1 RNase III inhibitor [Petrocella atlantisensis]